MKVLWISSLMLYLLQIVFNSIVIFLNYCFNTEFSYFVVELIKPFILFEVNVILVMSTLVMLILKKGYSCRYRVKEKWIYVSMIIGLLLELCKITIVWKLKLEMVIPVNTYVFSQVVTMAFILLLGSSYLLCKKDYELKMNKIKGNNIYEIRDAINIIIKISVVTTAALILIGITSVEWKWYEISQQRNEIDYLISDICKENDWEEKEISEIYTQSYKGYDISIEYFNNPLLYSNGEYSNCIKMVEEYIGEKICTIEDTILFENKEYNYIEVYQIKGIETDYMIGIKLPDSKEYLGSFNSKYEPENLYDFMNDLDFESNIENVTIELSSYKRETGKDEEIIFVGDLKKVFYDKIVNNNSGFIEKGKKDTTGISICIFLKNTKTIIDLTVSGTGKLLFKNAYSFYTYEFEYGVDKGIDFVEYLVDNIKGYKIVD